MPRCAECLSYRVHLSFVTPHRLLRMVAGIRDTVGKGCLHRLVIGGQFFDAFICDTRGARKTLRVAGLPAAIGSYLSGIDALLVGACFIRVLPALRKSSLGHRMSLSG
jgi:hypothetical protein